MSEGVSPAPNGPDPGPTGPEAMRARLADYVHALHRAYLSHTDLLAPAEKAAMPLVTREQVTVAVAAARDLHLIATTDPLPPPRGPEVELTEEYAGVRWTVRFYDPSILPELGVVAGRGPGADDPTTVRRVLGVADVVYHLSMSPGAGLGEHHAQHAGVALANQHAAAVREGQSLRHLFPGREHLVDEFVVADRTGLPHAAALLAKEIGGPALVDAGLTDAELAGDTARLRAALLRIGRGERP
ncbi:MAG: hypothetical protein R2731_00605 [Nocardioides sp.]